MAEYKFSPGQKVAVVWDSHCTPEALQEFVQHIQAAVRAEGHVSVEHLNQLLQSSHGESYFDVVLSGVIPGSLTVHGAEVLAEMARIVKPGGRVILKEVVTTGTGNSSGLKAITKLPAALTLSGLEEVKELRKEPLTSEQMQSVQQRLGSPCSELFCVEIEGKKPSFEVGSSSQLRLSFGKKPIRSGTWEKRCLDHLRQCDFFPESLLMMNLSDAKDIMRRRLVDLELRSARA